MAAQPPAARSRRQPHRHARERRHGAPGTGWRRMRRSSRVRAKRDLLDRGARGEVRSRARHGELAGTRPVIHGRDAAEENRAPSGRRRGAGADFPHAAAERAGTAARRRRCSGSATKRCCTRSSARNWRAPVMANRSVPRRQLARRHARSLRFHLPERAETRGAGAELPHAAPLEPSPLAKPSARRVTRQLARLVGGDVRETDLVAEGEKRTRVGAPARHRLAQLDVGGRPADVPFPALRVQRSDRHRHRRRVLSDPRNGRGVPEARH